MRTIVIGLGNPILTDDGVGVKVARELQKSLHLEMRKGLEVVEASVGGLRLMEMMVGYDRAIVIDAMTGRGGPPGTIRRMSLADLRDQSPTLHSTCIHDTSLVTALDLGERLQLPLPAEIDIYAIEVENVSDFGEEPTPAVAAAVQEATKAVLANIDDRA